MARRFSCEKGWTRLDRPEHGERHGADGVVADRPVAPRLRLVVDDDRAGLLVDGKHFGPQVDLAVQLAEERVGQQIHPAGDLLHVHVRLADVLAQDLDDRVVHVGLEEVHDRVVLDGALAPALLAQELVQRELVVLADDLRPRRLALVLDHRPQVTDGRLPQLIGGPTALVVGQGEGQARRLRIGLCHGHALAIEIDKAVGIAHHERPQRQVEEVAVLQRQVVGPRDAHRPRPRRTGRARSRASCGCGRRPGCGPPGP